MGFYGNVTNTSKTTFSFDLTYATRSDMDYNANLDGVFLGRYVLINYDEDPIKAYYYEGKFYNTALHADHSEITGRENAIYQDLHNSLSANSFYRYTEKNGFQPISTNSAYQERFSIDVKAYGRGYDSTVWVKRYDEATSAYKYVMIAELNAVVPTFHMVVNEPNAIPTTPYFDRDTTNIDYYLHMQSNFGNRVKKAYGEVKSDETADRIMTKWVNDDSGYRVGETYIEKNVPLDIYYNNAGFDHMTRHLMDETGVKYIWKDDNGQDLGEKIIDYTQNAIGYEMGQSGRLYGADADLGVYQEGYQADDIYDWYIRLPGIGNSICKMWDKIFGNPGNDNKRYINKALCRNDELSNLVTYDKTTLMGMINTTQDLLGYYFIPIGTDGHIAGKVIKNSALTVKVTLNHDETANDEVTGEIIKNYPALQCLFYSAADKKYYHYAYSPIYTPINPEETAEVCYRKLDNKYIIANKKTYKAKDANNNDLTFEEYYEREDAWELVELSAEVDDTIYGLIVEIHNLLGTNADDVRNIETVKGSINVIKDIISNINTNLMPGKLLHTNNQGVIETTDTYYPSSDIDATRVLVGKNPDHPWENRVRSIEIQDGNTSDTAWETSFGTIDTNENNNNTVTFKAGNKWIGLAVNPDTQLVTIRHMSSAQEERDFAGDVFIHTNIDGSTTSTTDCKITLPLVKTDNAGHVIGYSTKDIYIPYNYRNIALNEQSNAEDNITVRHGKQSADSTTDTFTFATGNKWIDAKIDEDSITYSHRLVPIDNLKNDVVLNGDRRTLKKQIENVFRYGLPQDKTYGVNGNLDEENDHEAANTFNIPYIEVDKAGHVVAAETHTVEIPHIYNKISTGDVINDKATEGQAGHTIDTLAGKTSVQAETLEEEIVYAPSNKWIRINATNTEGQDTVTFGHEIHTIVDTKPVPENLDSSVAADKTFTTQVVNWDEAGHIIEYGTKTWTLPNSIRNINITGTVNNSEVYNPNGTSGLIEADYTSDTVNMSPANKWIRLTAKNNSLTFGHLTQGTAKSYGTNVTFSQFGGTVNLQGYKTDEAGHVIDYPTYTLTLPIGSYKPDDSTAHNGARVITGIGFTASSGEITSTSQNVGTLKLNGYTKLEATTVAAITATNTINEAFAALDNRIETEEETRSTAITNLRMFKTINVGGTALEADSNADTLSITAGNNGIVLTPTASTDSFMISHKTGHEVVNGFYKFSTDAYGHVSATTAVTLSDLTNLGAATEANLTAHVTTVTDNPHNVTAKDIGLENVTNESKAIMFTSPVFTDTPKAPTAAAGTNTTQIATTAFVTTAVNNASDKVAWASNYANFDAVYAAVKQKLEEEYTLIPKEKEEENPIV